MFKKQKKAYKDEVIPVRNKKGKKLRDKALNTATKVREGAVGLDKKYMETARKSIRYEILNLVLIAGILAVITGWIVTGLASNMGIGRYYYTNYDDSRMSVQNRLSDAVRRLNSLDYMEISYQIEPNEVYYFMKNYSTEVVKEETYTKEYQDENISVEGQGEAFTPVEQTSSYTEDGRQIEITRDNYAIEDFQHFLNSNVVGNYNNETFYYNDEDETGIQEDVRILYNQLADQIEKNEWDNEKVRQMLEAYYQENSNKIIFKEKAVRDILRDLDDFRHYATDYKNYLLDGEGNVLYNEGIIKTIDVVEAIKKTTSSRYSESMITNIYPVILNGEIHYLFSEIALEGWQRTGYNDVPSMLGWLAGIVVFIFLIFKLTASKIRYIEYLSECLDEISKGNLDYEVEVKGEDELAKVARDMRHMESQLKKQIEERMQSEKTKNELITNVAHDLRTPLTSIIGYIGLVKEKKYETEEECERYLDIAYSKSERLKVLIEDLFEYTKLSNRVAELKLEHISAALLMNQLIEELRPQAEEKNLSIQSHVKTEDSGVYVDIMKMARVFENLLGNAIKYSMENEVIQVIIQSKNGFIYTTVRNRVQELPKEDITKLFDRFYRADSSRSSTTGGSGLGLAISKNIVEMHGGKIWAQLDGDRISFNVKLKQM